MDVIELVIADHDEAADLFEQLERLAADDARSNQAMRLVHQLAVSIKTHAKAEERILTDVMRSASPELAQLAREGPYEHQALDVMLDKLVLHRPGPELVAILHVAGRLFVQHARDEEEAVVLPALRTAVDPEERARLAHDFLVEKKRIRPGIERLVGAPARATGEARLRHLHVHLHHRR